MSKIKYQVGICSKCGKEKIITQKTLHLCLHCQDAYYRRNQVNKKQKPIPRYSESGRKRKAKDIDFYKKAWEKKQDLDGGCRCENCGVYLPVYSSTFVSHILTRGANPELAHDFDNYNILCLACHRQWETGDRGNMNIFWKNEERIENLKKKRHGFKTEG